MILLKNLLRAQWRRSESTNLWTRVSQLSSNRCKGQRRIGTTNISRLKLSKNQCGLAFRKLGWATTLGHLTNFSIMVSIIRCPKTKCLWTPNCRAKARWIEGSETSWQPETHKTKSLITFQYRGPCAGSRHKTSYKSRHHRMPAILSWIGVIRWIASALAPLRTLQPLTVLRSLWAGTKST